MCLAIPAEITTIDEDRTSAIADVLGVRRPINILLLADEPPQPGDWVLVHVGFAMSRISAARAREQLDLLARLGAVEEARREAAAGVSDLPGAPT